MNRQTLVDATIDAQGNVVLGESGHQIVYDTNGNRLSDTHAGNRLVSSTSGNTPLFYWQTGGDNGGGYMLSAAGVPMQDGDPVYGYAAVNVESQLRNPGSFLHWVQQMIVARKQHPVFGTGSYEVLDVANPAVLAFLRR